VKYVTTSILGFFISLIFGFSLFAQETPQSAREFVPRKNSFYIEFFGITYDVSSINYERIFVIGPASSLAARIGYSRDFNDNNLIPVKLTDLKGHKHSLEIGPGMVLGLDFNEQASYYLNDLSLRIGYRYRGNRGLLIRAVPVLFYAGGLYVWGGISIGRPLSDITCTQPYQNRWEPTELSPLLLVAFHRQ
jgi:hypothetical protein